ncbi:cob(I)yrinic acid a,c-diamide adenosyltransferase [Salinibius halmophilus]|uniref:cob(I)yrinic acid a,c-diamide adenosyltransferase n=1 Tax=Salinibius halmophilus TaxID=1853216 RepID=UPI000E66FC06|nr:cob(I)yrinic acid a,c-diamide adenosyltransferase [Salinibius halmophilus]
MDQQAHKEKMQALQAEQKAKVKAATEKRGIVILLSGDGKGKSSSAFGTALRMLGHDHKVGIVQFTKGKWKTGEQAMFQKIDGCDFESMGAGFTWDTQDRELDIKMAEAAQARAIEMINDEQYRLVVLDELTYMYSYDYLSPEPILAAIANRSPMKSVIITGRNPVPELIDVADTHSIVKNDKHAFASGVRAQKGIEF